MKQTEHIEQLEVREGWLDDQYVVDRNDPVIRKLDFVQNTLTTVILKLILPFIGFFVLFCLFLLIGGLLYL